MNSFLQD